MTEEILATLHMGKDEGRAKAFMLIGNIDVSWTGSYVSIYINDLWGATLSLTYPADASIDDIYGQVAKRWEDLESQFMVSSRVSSLSARDLFMRGAERSASSVFLDGEQERKVLYSCRMARDRLFHRIHGLGGPDVRIWHPDRLATDAMARLWEEFREEYHQKLNQMTQKGEGS